MSLLQRAIGAVHLPEKSETVSFWGGGTYTGERVSVDSALNLVPVYSAVSQIAGGIASLPLNVYQREGEFRSRAEQHRAWRLLHNEPNPEMGADEVWELVSSHIDLWGNAFLYKKRDSLGIVRELWPIHPGRVQVTRTDEGTRLFSVDGTPCDERTILQIRGLSADGFVGYSPIQRLRNRIAIAQQQERFQGEFLKNDGKPSILLRHPNELKPEAAKRLKASWDNVKAGGTVVLEENIEVEKWTMPLEDAQFIEQLGYSDKQIALLFLLPPARLGAQSAGSSLTYETAETQNYEFVTYTLNRRINRIEGALNRDPSIFSGTTRRFFCEFDVDALLRASMKDRYAAYAQGMGAGFLTADDVRPKENLPQRDIDPPAEPASPSPEPEGEPDADA